jgi:hypothetical protein
VGARRFVRRRSTLTDNRGASLRAAFLLGCFLAVEKPSRERIEQALGGDLESWRSRSR